MGLFENFENGETPQIHQNTKFKRDSNDKQWVIWGYFLSVILYTVKAILNIDISLFYHTPWISRLLENMLC